jgi:hypothetical protein
MAIHAIHDLKAGDEIFRSYISPYELYDNRKKICDLYGFVCQCKLCILDHNDHFNDVRKNILDNLIEKM